MEPILGHLVAVRGKGQSIRTQELSAAIPRESVCPGDCGAQRQLGTLPPLRKTLSFSLEEHPSSQLHLKGLIISRNPWSLESVHSFLVVQKDPVPGTEL